MKKRFLITAALFALFVAYTVLVSTVDVQPIGPEGSEVGFAGINGYFRDAIGYHESWHITADYIGYSAFVSVAIFGFMGLTQLIRYRKADFRLWLLGGFYILMLVTYILFKNVVINYRPVILDEGLEASYPSSHTVLGVCCMGAAMMQIQYLLKKQPMLRAVLMGVCLAVGILLPVGRLLAGVHWFTDIVGGAILSAAFLMLYYTMVKYVGVKQRKKRPAKRL